MFNVVLKCWPPFFKKTFETSPIIGSMNRLLSINEGKPGRDSGILVLQCDAIRPDTFHKPKTYEPQVYTCFKPIIAFARDKHGK